MTSDDEGQGVRLTAAEMKARRRRSIAIAVTLFVLVVLFYVVSLFRIGG